MPARPTPAGRRRDRLAIQRPASPAVTDDNNTVLPVYETVLTIWADKQALAAREFLAAQQAQSEINGTLKFPRSAALAAINSTWRAVHLQTGTVLNFVGCYDPDGMNREWLVYFTEKGMLDTDSLPGPALMPNLALWLRAKSDTLFQDVMGATAAGDGDTASLWIRPGDTATDGSHVNAYQTVPPITELPPTVSVDSDGRYWLAGGANVALDLSNSVVLSGDFILWAVAKWKTATRLIVLSNENPTGDGIYLVDDPSAVFENDAGSQLNANYSGASGPVLLRWRRRSGVVSFAATGQKEVTLGTLTGDFTAQILLSCVSLGDSTDAANAVGEIVISTDSITAANPPPWLDAAGGYFDTATPGGTAAWGVSLP